MAKGATCAHDRQTVRDWKLGALTLATLAACTTSDHPTDAAQPGPVDAGVRDAAAFDDASAPDSAEPPAPFRLERAEVVDPTTVALSFSAAPSDETATDPSQYQIRGVPVIAAARGSTITTVLLRTHHIVGAPGRLEVDGATAADGQRLSGQTDLTITGAGLDPTAAESFELTTLPEVLNRGWAIVDDPRAVYDRPSRWTVESGVLLQSSNIYGGANASRAGTNKFGTYFLHDHALGDTVISAVLTNHDDDGMGLIARYRDARKYYRFEWMKQGGVRRLVRLHPAGDRVIDADLAPFESGQPYRLRLAVQGRRISAFVNDLLVLQGTDDVIADGLAGIFVWGSDNLAVHAVSIARLPNPGPSYPEPTTRMRPSAPIATHGTVVGALTSSSAKFWVRASSEASVQLRYGTDRSLADRTAAKRTTDADAHTAQFELTGLEPGTTYFASAALADPSSGERNHTAVREIRTLPRPDVDAPVDIVFFADVHQGAPQKMGAFDVISAMDPDLLLCLGDVPYMDAEPAASTRDAFLAKHAFIRSEPRFVSLLGQVPIYGMWDDHEVTNDWDARTSASLVQTGVQAWKLWWPHNVAAGAPALSNYRSVRIGANVEVFLLDTRSQRSSNAASDGPAKTILGPEQATWLHAGLLASGARFKIIVSSVPLRFGTTGNDHWAGYVRERTALFDHINSNQIEGVLFLSGDQHWHAVHHHPEGFSEFQASGISASVRTPPAMRDPAVVFLLTANGFGRVQVRGGDDPRVLVTLHTLDGTEVYDEEVR